MFKVGIIGDEASQDFQTVLPALHAQHISPRIPQGC